MLKGNPKQKMLHELDQKSPEELLAYHCATMNDLREHIANHGILENWVSKLIHAIILDYTWLYSKHVLGVPYPDAYLSTEERERYKSHIERIEQFNFYLSQRTFLLDVTTEFWEEEKRKDLEFAAKYGFVNDMEVNHDQINKELQKGKTYVLPEKQNRYKSKSNHLRVVGE